MAGESEDNQLPTLKENDFKELLKNDESNHTTRDSLQTLHREQQIKQHKLQK
jgi:hypothetical protein